MRRSLSVTASPSLTDDLWSRAWNWGRSQWRELMRDAPDCSCVNSIYDMGEADRDGDGEVTDDTQIVDQEIEAKAELPPIDEDDAEVIHAWIKQIPEGAQATLWARFVYRRPISRPVVDNALHAIWLAMQANRAVVERMRG